ncbi:cocaine- and amphetamine-regulated transcript protein-like [Epinephelus fuscoguttatus]|uniref:cocaine- and amphetamine-regulated transcript protein-like n=1 Tax=Epinephelus fuscoguttatus TaxID=293821 RepID=UPI0020D03262|nr:cocaine- and amphetamine-regulated transcript protein-like [Epinephelus fuscoguttatus]XP_049440890.1 cocaine- and amphetamine-regulated transcript protein-like [Epinephelus fuscoguttatus]
MNTPASIFIVLLSLLLLLLASSGETGSRWTDETERKSEDSRELLLVLQNVLEKLQNRKSSNLNRRQSRLPTCEARASCSVKKGPRFGQLCDCPPGSRCHLFFLRCL